MRWSRDPYTYFRGFLALALAAAVVALTALAALLLQRFYARETVTVTAAAVNTHFDMLFDPRVFTGQLADPRRFDGIVRMHLGLYDVVDTRFYAPDGRVVYSYDPDRIGSSAGPAAAGRVARAMAGEVATDWQSDYVAPNGERYDTVLRILVPISGAASAPAAGAGGNEYASGPYGEYASDPYGEYAPGPYGGSGSAGTGPDTPVAPNSAPMPDDMPAMDHGAPAGIIGVVEVLRDATPGLALVRSVQAVAAAVLLVVGVVLYLGLGRMFWSSTRRIRQQSLALEQTLSQLEAAYDSTLRTLSRALDARDSETEGHSLRVAAYTVHLAQRLGVAAQDLGHLFRGALLHDVGKIAVPDAILRKPGPLTEDEWVEMRRHPAAGHSILRDVPFLQDALPVVLHHHERWDGNGYPAGLAGERIPLGARVFAVIDTLDAMTSDRPYRKARSPEEARQEISQNSGTQFDPRVVEAFLAVPAGEWLELRRLVAAGQIPGSSAVPGAVLPLAGD